MKKLYRKGTVHPSPPSTSDHHLSFLPAAIFVLTVALSAQEKEVLAYLISFGNHHHHHHRKSSTGNGSVTTGSGGGGGGGSGRRSADHPVSFSCYCFDCYMSYWVKWDSSPNRQLIHEIIDAFEDAPSPAAASSSKKEKNKKARRKNKKNPAGPSSPVKSEAVAMEIPPPLTESPEVTKIPADGGEGESSGGQVEEEEINKGSSVRRFVSFVGEKIWGIWN